MSRWEREVHEAWTTMLISLPHLQARIQNCARWLKALIPRQLALPPRCLSRSCGISVCRHLPKFCIRACTFGIYSGPPQLFPTLLFSSKFSIPKSVFEIFLGFRVTSRFCGLALWSKCQFSCARKFGNHYIIWSTHRKI